MIFIKNYWNIQPDVHLLHEARVSSQPVLVYVCTYVLGLLSSWSVHKAE